VLASESTIVMVMVVQYLLCQEENQVAIGPEVTILFDSRPQALTEAYDRKFKCCRPLTTALQGYIDSGLDVCVLSWVVGVLA
jgi:hypothetical protein